MGIRTDEHSTRQKREIAMKSMERQYAKLKRIHNKAFRLTEIGTYDPNTARDMAAKYLENCEWGVGDRSMYSLMLLLLAELVQRDMHLLASQIARELKEK